jgi:hypothetical protein
VNGWGAQVTAEKTKDEEKAEATRQLVDWLLAHCDIEQLPELVSWMEQAKPKDVTNKLMAVLTKHRRQKMSGS